MWCIQLVPIPVVTIDIAVKKLLPIVIAVVIWGNRWANKSILCRYDNEAVVYIINTGTSKNTAAEFNLLFSAVHLAGSANDLADALSRNKMSVLLVNHPQAKLDPSLLPVALLVHKKPDWTSPSWRSMFNSIFSPVSPRTHCVPILVASADTLIFAPASACSHSPHKSTFCVSSSSSLGGKASTPDNQVLPVQRPVLSHHQLSL